MIRRAARPTHDFTIIRNDVLRDSRLSYRARGILAAILSRPDNWTIRSEQLAREGGEGRDAIRTALKELRDFGYLRSVSYQDAETGRFHTDQVVFDYPTDDFIAPGNPSPKPGNPASENQASENQALLEELKRRTVKKDSPSVYTSSDDDGLFDQWWNVYPRKIGKGQARIAFRKALRKTDFQTLLSEAARYAEERFGQDQGFTAHPATWLNGERWLDEKDAARPAKPATLRDRENDFVRKALTNIQRGEPRELR
jgi:hypothetical protein